MGASARQLLLLQGPHRSTVSTSSPYLQWCQSALYFSFAIVSPIVSAAACYTPCALDG